MHIAKTWPSLYNNNNAKVFKGGIYYTADSGVGGIGRALPRSPKDSIEVCRLGGYQN